MSYGLTLTKVSYVDENSAVLNINARYNIPTTVTSVRLIVVSKATNVLANEFTQIEHFNDLPLPVSSTSGLSNFYNYVFKATTRYYQAVLETTTAGGIVENYESSYLDLTDLPFVSDTDIRPKVYDKTSFRNSIVVYTNISSNNTDSNPLFRLNSTNLFTFVVDLFNLTTKKSTSVRLSNYNVDPYDVTVTTGTTNGVENVYTLHLCDLNVNTPYLIVYHIEYTRSGTTFYTKDCDEIRLSTTNTAPTISDEALHFYPEDTSYPVADQLTSPTGIRLTWKSSVIALYDPNCDDNVGSVKYKVRRRVVPTPDTDAPVWTTLINDQADAGASLTNTYDDVYNDTDSPLVAGTIYEFSITAGLQLTGQTTDYGTVLDTVKIKAPYLRTPNSLVVTFDTTTSTDASTHKAHIFNDPTNGIDLNWTALNETSLNGYQLKNGNTSGKLYIRNTANLADTPEEVNNTDLVKTYIGLTNGTEYNKYFSYQPTRSNWEALTLKTLALKTADYHSPVTQVSFVPYGILGDVNESNFTITYSPEYGAYNGTVTAQLNWNDVVSCGLNGNVTYYLTVTKNIVTPTPSTVILTNFNNINVLTSDKNVEVDVGYNYTFDLYASQTDSSCTHPNSSTPLVHITQVSTNHTIKDKDALRTSSPVTNLTITNVSRSSFGYDIPTGSAEVAPLATTVTNLNIINLSATRPTVTSWPTQSTYYVSFSTADGNDLVDLTVGDDNLVSETEVSMTRSIFNTTMNQYNLDADPTVDNETNSLTDNQTYTVTITPKVSESNTVSWGTLTTATFKYIHIPEVLTVTLSVFTDLTMEVTWTSDEKTTTNVFYELFLQKGSDAAVYVKTVASSSTLSSIISKTEGSFVIGSAYRVYVRAYKKIKNDSNEYFKAYISNAAVSAQKTFFEPPTVSLPVYDDLKADVAVMNGITLGALYAVKTTNLLTFNLNPTTTSNGVTNINYKIVCQRVLSNGYNSADIASVNTSIQENTGTAFTDWMDGSVGAVNGMATTTPSTTYSALVLPKLGYYNFKTVITQYTDANSNIVSCNIESNSSSFFVLSKPVILSSTDNNDLYPKNTLTINVYNQWSGIATYIGIIIPKNSQNYQSAFKMYETNYLDSSTITTRKLNYVSSAGASLLQETHNLEYLNLVVDNVPISKTFITVSNICGTDFIYLEAAAT